jgi:hypothetical protein
MSGVGDFDFFVGSWDGRQRRLRKALADSDDWYEFATTTQCWSVFGGAANVDEVTAPDQGFSGLSVRLFDPAAGQWSIYWANSRNGILGLPPVVGTFADGVGRFYADEDFEGTPITVRFTWSDITATTARWEQAFSTDGRKTWEPNWIADFTRRD